MMECNGRSVGKLMDELKSGILNPLLERVKSDTSLQFDIRKDYFNIYYRGGSLLRVEKKGSKLDFVFDINYCRGSKDCSKQEYNRTITSLQECECYIDKFPYMKNAMDLWFGEHPKDEREFQQLLVRENSHSNRISNSTDYFIIDQEYANSELGARFDAVAVCWASKGYIRKKGSNLQLALIEVKYGDGALKGSSGIKKHIADAEELCNNKEKLRLFKQEMVDVFNQKKELGLINIKHDLESFSDAKPELIFVLANHDPDSRLLKDILDEIEHNDEQSVGIKFAVSNFMGYGLFEENIFTLEEFKERLKKQIYSKSKRG